MSVGRIWVRRVLLGLVASALLFVGLLASWVRADVPVSELLPKYAGEPSRFADIEGMRVHYRDEGQGLPLVLLHGTSSSLHTWDDWVLRLKERRRIVRLDLPGYGLTGPAPDADYTPARLARVVVKLLDKLSIERADVAGNSLGGRVALTMALDQRARVERLILVAASGLSGQRPPSVFRLAQSSLGGAVLRWVTPRFLVRANTKQVYGDLSRLREDVVDRYYDVARRAGNRQALIDRFQAAAPPALDARLKELHLPTLILWGGRDTWIPPSFGERFARGIAGAQLIVYPDAGHVPMEELPAQTARDAEAFLEDSDAARMPTDAEGEPADAESAEAEAESAD
jgi:pimeloyl-ACP methyl ester carboxylesterase